MIIIHGFDIAGSTGRVIKKYEYVFPTHIVKTTADLIALCGKSSAKSFDQRIQN
jgi:hypothetical protein